MELPIYSGRSCRLQHALRAYDDNRSLDDNGHSLIEHGLMKKTDSVRSEYHEVTHADLFIDITLM